MREYKIYKTDLWYSIYRKKYVWKIMLLQFLNWRNLRSTNKASARTFYNQDSAVSTLVVMRAKWDNNTVEKPIEIESEKQSWSEL